MPSGLSADGHHPGQGFDAPKRERQSMLLECRDRGVELDPTELQERELVHRSRLAGWIPAGEHNRAALAGQPQQPHTRSEEHTSELQSQSNLVCRPLPAKKKI